VLDPLTAVPDPARRNPIGTHVLVGKGLVDGAVANADVVGAETFQVFCGNPRGWALSAGKPADDERFRSVTAERGTRVFIHAPYLVNLGSPTAATYERSVASVAHNLRRAVEIGAEGVVVHTGSYVDPGDPADAAGSAARHATAMRQVREGLLPLLDALLDHGDRGDHGGPLPCLLLEPTAGQGRSLCAGVDDLAAYLDALDHHPLAGICLDTCHVFAAGAPLDEPGGATATVDRVVEIGGPGRLRLVHANDSRDVRGAFKDRHQRIGEGHIGEAAFAELFAHPATAGVPFILETPDSRAADNRDIPLLKRLRASVAGAGVAAGAAAGAAGAAGARPGARVAS
jgi:deoxyribonuclease-4